LACFATGSILVDLLACTAGVSGRLMRAAASHRVVVCGVR
jgi:hypothetical protein